MNRFSLVLRSTFVCFFISLHLSFLRRTALEVAVLLKEHPGYMCPMLTLVQEYQSRSVKEDLCSTRKTFAKSRFCKPLHMSELNTARDIIEIQYNGNMGFARLSSAFRATITHDALPVPCYHFNRK